MLAVGGSVSPTKGGGWDFLPLVGFLLALVALLAGLRIRPSWRSVALAFVAGTVWSWTVAAWGVVVPTSLAYLVLVVAASVRRRAWRG